MNESDNHSVEDQDVAQLMAFAGPRDRPPADVEARVRAAVMQTFDELPAPVSVFRRRIFPALAAVAATVALAYLLLNSSSVPRPAGEIQFSSGAFSLLRPDGAIARTDTIAPGSTLQTGVDGRVLVRLGERLHFRSDSGTRVTLISSSELRLHQGRIYVDSRDGEPLTVRTRYAVITDIGTLFEIVADDEELTVAIREGAVDVRVSSLHLRSGADAGVGELLRFKGATLQDRTEIAASDDHWRWTQQARPGFRLAGRSVAEYLEWATRESGLQLHYESELVRQQATMPQALQGNAIVDSDPDSIAQVLRATRFDLVSSTDDELIVGFRTM